MTRFLSMVAVATFILLSDNNIYVSGTSHLVSAKIQKAQKANKERKYALLYFTATWCGPCKLMSKELEKPAVIEKLDSITFYKIDIDEYRDKAKAYAVGPVPTLILIEVLDGDVREISRTVGVQSSTNIIKMINKATDDASS